MSSTPYIVPGHEHVVIQDPNNITPEECHALALCGPEAWNMWRRLFPIRDFLNKQYENRTSFKNVIFEDVFAGAYEFGEGAEFENVTFVSDVILNDLKLKKDITFSNVEFCGSFNVFDGNFGGSVRFKSCTWRKIFSFNNVSLNGHINIDGCDFYEFYITGGKFASLRCVNSKFKEHFLVKGSSFKEAVDFTKVELHSMTMNKVSFESSFFFRDCIINQPFYANDCQFKEACFFKCKWFSVSDFANTKWVGNVQFCESFFDDYWDITSSIFEGYFSAIKCNVNKSSYFMFSSWKKDVAFIDVKFSDSSITSFSHSKFYGRIEFSLCELGDFRISCLKNDGGKDVNSISFSASVFSGLADFSGRTFLGRTYFDPYPNSVAEYNITESQLNEISLTLRVATIKFPIVLGNLFDVESWYESFIQRSTDKPVVFKKAPKFFNSVLNQDTSFYKAEFPNAVGDDSAARSYCALKKAFLEMHDTRQADLFAKLELKEERLLEPYKSPALNRSRKFLYASYGLLSDYGFSAWRPLFSLTVLFAIAMAVYGEIAGFDFCIWPGISCDWQATQEIVRYTFQAVPFMGGFEVGEKSSLKALESSGGALAMMFFHKLSTIILLFLTGLALRNLFRMK